jgi:hypothetical protein
MTVAGLPFVAEGIRTYATQRSILRTYLFIPGALAIALLITWPQGTVQSVFLGGSAADGFTVVSVTCLLILLYLGGRYGAEDYSPETFVNLREYVTLTPASVASLVAGKAAFSIVHTIFLVTLGAPFLLSASSVSGAPRGSLAGVLAVLATAAFAARMYGLLLLAMMGQRRFLRVASFLAGVGAYLFVTYLVEPGYNPIAMVIAARDGASLLPIIIFNLGASLLLAAGVAAVLVLARRGARRHVSREALPDGAHGDNGRDARLQPGSGDDTRG